ncbi:ESF1 homolog [Ylistrum balloti]|uniref:ESF1 homolog n=1 Tax=Ylistrum balloti TaxID=509963 RepID=UPI002905D363|nr:ESF1 homolog [Ylistrum balloti]
MEDILKDERFSHIVKDKRFRRVPLNERRVKIDKRFKGMFSDKKFKMKYTIDKRGRPMNLSANEDLHKFYELDSEEGDSDNDEDDDGDKTKKKLKKKTKKVKESKTVRIGKKTKGKSIKEEDEDVEETNSMSSEEEESGPDVKGTDLARGEGNVESSSDDEGDDDVEEDLFKSADGEVDHKWNEMDQEAPEARELGRRLAICNLDWDRIKAMDIFVLLSSFLPTGGVLHSVKIYPSEFGKARMAEEAVKGPTGLVKSTKIEGYSSDEEVTEDSEGTIYHREKLRQYQLTRLKYYYAVAEFDSMETANSIYGACDGTEYESSATRLDLRFIPDDMTFDENETKSVCNTMPTSNVYKPSLFFTSALCQSKVDLTWDETDHDRLKVTMRAPSKMDTATEEDFKAYLASSSDEEANPYGNILGASDDESHSEESENEDKHIDKYRKLLQSIQDTEKEQDKKDVEMEVTWEPGLKQVTEKILKKKEEEKDSTTWEKYLVKKKEKKQKKREEKKMKEKEESKIKGKASKADNEAVDDDGEVAFSDDDLPDDFDMSGFQDDLGDSGVKKGKKKKKKKIKEKLTEEEKKEKATQEAELSLLMMDEKEDDRRHFNLKDLVDDNTSKKKKKKKFKKKDLLKNKGKSEDDFKVDVADNRFTAMYSSHMYNLDPTAPEYKRTKGMEAIVSEKLKRSKQQRDQSVGGNRKRDREGDATEPQIKVKRDSNVNEHQGQEASLQSLIKSVKTKTQNYNIKLKTKR